MWSKPAGSATAAQVLSQLALSVMFLISLYKIARFHNGVVQSLTLTAGGASAAFSAQSASDVSRSGAFARRSRTKAQASRAWIHAFAAYGILQPVPEQRQHPAQRYQHGSVTEPITIIRVFSFPAQCDRHCGRGLFRSLYGAQVRRHNRFVFVQSGVADLSDVGRHV